MKNYNYLERTHDLPSLSDWGPYANDVYGLSHIADYKKGLRIDFFMVPGIFRRQFYFPDPLRESGCSPMTALPNLEHFSFRQQLLELDKFFCDVSYTKIDENFYLGRCCFENHLSELQSASLLMYTRVPAKYEVIPVMPKGCQFIDGLDYSELKFSAPRYDHNLTSSGGRRGEQPCKGTVNGSCLGLPHYDGNLRCFGADNGDEVSYFYTIPKSGNRKVFLRALVEENIKFDLEILIADKKQKKSFTGSGQFDIFEIYNDKLASQGEIKIISCGVTQGLRIDGLILAPEKTNIPDIEFRDINNALEVKCQSSDSNKIDIFTAESIDKNYAVWWSCNETVKREYRLKNLSQLVLYSNNLRHPFYSSFPNAENGSEYCRDIYTLPIEIAPKAKKVFYTLYCVDKNAEKACEKIKNFDTSDKNLEKIFALANKKASKLITTKEGKKYRFGRMMLSAVSLTNINFPIRAEGKNIRHHVPDKHFNSLYSWDSGFIGLGFTEIDKVRAIENLNAYLTEPDNDVNAFIFHGTPLPVQAYLYKELFCRTHDMKLLEFFYPKLKHFYDFTAGHIPSSIFRTAKSNLLRPWDYTYNSGGWDDYPPQWEIFTEKNFSIAPVVTTAHQIRFAKIMRRAAIILGKKTDISTYDSDIEDFSNTLQQYSYDSQEGIFSYVEHDKNGNPLGFYSDKKSGRNYNLGMDGVSPLISGICTKEQKNKMFERLSNPQKMWTPIGISTVDKQAPYYRSDGYWNGAIWMPHQWFFWKAALDDNQMTFARKIAITALNVWEKELRKSRYCFEHFCLSSQRGAGCCHFGGLSSPILNFFGAYCTPRRLSCGNDTWVLSSESRHNCYTAQLLIEGNSEEFTGILFTNERNNCIAHYQEKIVAINCTFPGCWEIILPKNTQGVLRIDWE